MNRKDEIWEDEKIMRERIERGDGDERIRRETSKESKRKKKWGKKHKRESKKCLYIKNIRKEW